MSIDIPQMAKRRMVLATDLDGTFLGGFDVDRARLYDWINRNRLTVGLIFVTGRDLGFIHDMCSNGRLPWPEYVIGDVGTTIAEVTPGKTIQPMKPLEDEISSLWKDSGPMVKSLLDGCPGLTLQETDFRYRVSYHYDPETFDPDGVLTVREMGHDVLISDNRFLDVLPNGVSKGPSLLRLLKHLEVHPARVLAAGDTLNDLSMLLAGTNAVAVGGAEAPLLDALPDSPQIYRATGIGAAGITEAIAHFDLHEITDGNLNHVL